VANKPFLRFTFYAALLAGVCLTAPAQAQPTAPPDSSARAPAAERQFHPKRFWPVMGGAVVADVGVMYGLHQLWYAGSQNTSFRFYSNNPRVGGAGGEHDHGWLDDWYTYAQQDKLGHAFVAWRLARVFGAYGRWTGMNDARAGLFGAGASALFQSQVEIFDGFAAQYGFSRTDVLANVAGAALGGLKVAYPQRLDWFTAKYSYHPSPYRYRNLSGRAAFNYLGNVLKDYDGISYWLVVRPEELLAGRAKARWPDWLALSVGYSANDITHAISGTQREQRLGPGPAGHHKRQLLISPDIDVLGRSTTRDWPQPLKALAGFFSFVRLPMPALQLTPDVRWHWVFY
jgi:uncharacterized protein YfiM (DUF2279 family)